MKNKFKCEYEVELDGISPDDWEVVGRRLVQIGEFYYTNGEVIENTTAWTCFAYYVLKPTPKAEPSTLVWNDIKLLQSLDKTKSHLLMLVGGDLQFPKSQPAIHWVDDATDYDYYKRYTSFAVVCSYAMPSSDESTNEQ